MDVEEKEQLDGGQLSASNQEIPSIEASTFEAAGPGGWLRNYILKYPVIVLGYFQRLSNEFGWRMVVLIMLVYGLNQGFGEEFGFMAGNYYLKDVLGLDVAKAQSMNNIMMIPWTIKPLYGMVSDTFPILGFSRGPYILGAGFFGTLAWMMLAGLPLQVWSACLCFVVASMSIASPDVMVDAVVAENSRTHPSFTADLQSLCWGSYAVGGLVACTMVGWIEDKWSPQAVFFLTSFTAVALVVPAAKNWLGEKRLPRPLWKPKWQQVSSQWHLFALAATVSISATVLSVVVVNSTSAITSGVGGLSVSVLASVLTYFVLKRYNIWMGKVALYLFLIQAMQISAGEAFFYWYTDYDKGPKFTPEFLGMIDLVSYLSMMVGVSVYNRFLSQWRYRQIFILAQVCLASVNLLDLVFVLRLNLKVGLPDQAFVLGEEAIAPLFRRMLMMPTFVLASKVCPPGIEGTLFALLMSLMNFGGIVAKITGVGAVKLLGITKTDYSGLPILVLVKSITRLLPILLIPMLVPDLKPSDNILPEGEEADEIEQANLLKGEGEVDTRGLLDECRRSELIPGYEEDLRPGSIELVNRNRAISVEENRNLDDHSH
mmetsp:Transcript_32556/g.41751  ORF Transcript_32556/g.41751 Transcript_32556/m.41751 type:complete len:600 (-) Transcript_32556:58-1857(-)